MLISATALLWGTTALGQSLPTGGTVAAGNVTIGQPSGNQLQITQGSSAAIVNWNGFSIGSGATVNIQQPNAQSVILNRVTGDTTSQIHGQLNANGQVHLVNPNGIFIGPNGHVNTAGFVASTLAITDEDFLNGRYRYQGNGQSAAVENAGTISVVPGGYAALIGGKVSNSGVIRVPVGKVGLAAGEQVTLDVSGDGFLQVAVPSDSGDATMEALVTNSGRIEADGGIVHLKAASARDAARQVVNMSGVIEARSVGGVSGAVVLGGGGGAVQVTGRIDTSAPVTLVAASPRPVARSQSGGSITITGEAIELAGATLDASGAGAGDGGAIRVGGDLQGGGDLQRARTTQVDAATTLSANGGDQGNGGLIIVWSDDYTSFSGFNSARGGDLGGDGGFVEVSGKQTLSYTGLSDTRAPVGAFGTLLLDPTNITVAIGASGPGAVTPGTIEANLGFGNVTLTTAGSGTLQPNGDPIDLGGDDSQPGTITVEDAITWSNGSRLTLRADSSITLNAAITATSGELELDAATTIGTGAGGTINVDTFTLTSGAWSQVSATLPSFAANDLDIESGATFTRALGGAGSAGSPFLLTDVFGLQGISDGNSYALANSIDAGPLSEFDSIDYAGGTLEGNGFAINNLSISSTSFGGLFDDLDGTVQNLRINGASVSSGGGGILAGTNGGTISGVSVSGSYSSTDEQAGGLVGFNDGSIVDSFSTASVSVATTEASIAVAGGLVGQNNGTITRSHSTGTVDGSTDGDHSIGGLVGDNRGLVQDSYSTGSVSGTNQNSAPGDTANLGGLVGVNTGGTIARSYSTGGAGFSGPNTPALGGLVGSNTGSVSGSFWNTDTSGLATSAGGTGLTTAELQDTIGFFNLASAQGWNFSTTWAPGTGSSNPLHYTTSAVLFAIPDQLAVAEGETDTATATGTISGGPSVFRFGPSGDTLDTSPIFQTLTFDSTENGITSFTVDTSSLLSTSEVLFSVSALPGTAIIGGTTTIIPTPPTPTIEITPTVDTTITGGGGGGGGTTTTTTTEAEAALGTVENASQEFDEIIASCAAQGNDVSAYLACIAEAMDEYASDLDAIVQGLPPGLESVGDIIRGASAGIKAAGEDANRRLALATTAEERNAIRREAVDEARRQIRQAQREIRKAITLIRATDPELVSIQNQQVETIVAAVGQAEIGLSRAIGL
ncbi:MAG: filamentous hemagglutinin N-terminal domain-containing protein [Pseudomonadota bacterium]